MNLQRAEGAAKSGRCAMAQLGGDEREVMIAQLNCQAEELIAWQSTPARQQVRLPTYSLVSYLLGLRRRFFNKVVFHL